MWVGGRGGAGHSTLCPPQGWALLAVGCSFASCMAHSPFYFWFGFFFLLLLLFLSFFFYYFFPFYFFFFSFKPPSEKY